jgi:hypothetical protein
MKNERERLYNDYLIHTISKKMKSKKRRLIEACCEGDKRNRKR